MMKNLLMMAALGALMCVGVNAADFSKKSDSELIALSGKVKVEEYVDYKLEVGKRMKAKSEKEAKEFGKKLKEQFEKATENMSVKQLREYRKATHEAMEKHLSKLSEKEKKELMPHHKGCEGKGDKKSGDNKDRGEKACKCEKK